MIEKNEAKKIANLSMVLALIALPVSASAQTANQMADVTQSADDAQRQANNQHDWWLVSTTGYGRDMHRFYIDREKMTSMEPLSRAWVDHYWMSANLLMRDKILMLADCNDSAPRLNFKTVIAYGNGESAPKTQQGNSWVDVVPESSQETQWRFICHSNPANAIVFIPDGPEADARRHFARFKGVGRKK